MCGYHCIEFINYMLKSKTLLDYTNLFSPNDFKKNDQVIKRMLKKMNNLELTDINNYRLNEINKVKDYFNDEINKRRGYKIIITLIKKTNYKRCEKKLIVYHVEKILKILIQK